MLMQSRWMLLRPVRTLRRMIRIGPCICAFAKLLMWHKNCEWCTKNFDQIMIQSVMVGLCDLATIYTRFVAQFAEMLRFNFCCCCSGGIFSLTISAALIHKWFQEIRLQREKKTFLKCIKWTRWQLFLHQLSISVCMKRETTTTTNR